LTKAKIQAITSVAVQVVFDAIGTEETQKAGLEVSAAGGHLLVIHAPHKDVETLAAQGGIKVIFPIANKTLPQHVAFMQELWANIGPLVEEGDIKVTILIKLARIDD
jgi:NADPH:quinone reductase-like Zn-dependent oxidoreductase